MRGDIRKQKYWVHPFIRDGKLLSWEQAMAEFRDATGQEVIRVKRHFFVLTQWILCGMVTLEVTDVATYGFSG